MLSMRHLGVLVLAAVVVITSSIGVKAERRQTQVIGEVWFLDPANTAPYQRAFRSGLGDLGYIEGRNIQIVSRYANGDSAVLAGLVKDLLSRQVDVIVVTPMGVQIAAQVTKTVPIVSAAMGDTVLERLAQSLARPGGNVTGLTAQGPDTDSKRLQRAMELVPGLKRVALLFDRNLAGESRYAERFRAQAKTVGVNVHLYGARNLIEIEHALSQIERDRAQTLIIFASGLFNLHRSIICQSAAHRLPLITEGKEWAEAGALVTYSPNWEDMWRRTSLYVDRILKGANPGDLPIEQPTKFELSVNLRSARALGIAVPQSILVQAEIAIR
jgi:putative ABC transport system substrate-binding protein